MATDTATTTLARLREQAATNGRLARDAQGAAQQAQLEPLAAHERVIAAMAAGDKAEQDRATRARDQARTKAGQLADQVEAADRVAQQAQQAVSSFELGHALDLIADRKQHDDQIPEQMLEGARMLVAAAAEWAASQGESGRLVQLAGGRVHGDVPNGHGLEQVVQTLLQIVEGHRDIPSPQPTWDWSRRRQELNTAQAAELEARGQDEHHRTGLAI